MTTKTYKTVTPDDGMYLYNESEGVIATVLRTTASDEDIAAKWVEIDADKKAEIEEALKAAEEAAMAETQAEATTDDTQESSEQ